MGGALQTSFIRDNYPLENAGEFLRMRISEGSRLSVFTEERFLVSTALDS